MTLSVPVSTAWELAAHPWVWLGWCVSHGHIGGMSAREEDQEVRRPPRHPCQGHVLLTGGTSTDARPAPLADTVPLGWHPLLDQYTCGVRGQPGRDGAGLEPPRGTRRVHFLPTGLTDADRAFEESGKL